MRLFDQGALVLQHRLPLLQGLEPLLQSLRSNIYSELTSEESRSSCQANSRQSLRLICSLLARPLMALASAPLDSVPRYSDLHQSWYVLMKLPIPRRLWFWLRYLVADSCALRPSGWLALGLLAAHPVCC